MLEGELLLGQLLQADDDVLLGDLSPAALRDERCAGSLELAVVEDALAAALHIDGVAGLDQLLGGGGRQGASVLERLALGTQVQYSGGHVVDDDDGLEGLESGLTAARRCNWDWQLGIVEVLRRKKVNWALLASVDKVIAG